jgi:exonuclease SbcC
LAQTSQAGRRLSARTRVLARLTPPPELAATAILAATRDRLVRLRADTAGLAATAGRLSALRPPPELAETASLVACVAALAAARRARSAKEKALATARQALADGEARIAARLETLGACPLCGARLCLDAFLGAGHDHGPTEAAS